MPPVILNEEMVGGTVHRFRLEIINERTGALTNISSWQKFWCTIKADKTDADPGALQLTSPASGVVVLDPTNGLIEVTIADTEFDAAPYVGVTTHLYIDVKGKDAASLHWALAMGRLTVVGTVTQAVT